LYPASSVQKSGAGTRISTVERQKQRLKRNRGIEASFIAWSRHRVNMTDAEAEAEGLTARTRKNSKRISKKKLTSLITVWEIQKN